MFLDFILSGGVCLRSARFSPTMVTNDDVATNGGSGAILSLVQVCSLYIRDGKQGFSLGYCMHTLLEEMRGCQFSVCTQSLRRCEAA